MRHWSFFLKKERKKKDTFRDISVRGKNAVVKQQLVGWAFSSGFGLNQVGNESGR